MHVVGRAALVKQLGLISRDLTSSIPAAVQWRHDAISADPDGLSAEEPMAAAGDLEASPLLSMMLSSQSFDPSEVAQLVSVSQFVRFSAGQPVVHSGHPWPFVMFVLRGTLWLERWQIEAEAGAQIGAVEFFERPHINSPAPGVVARSDGIVAGLSYAEIDLMVSQDGALGHKLLLMLGEASLALCSATQDALTTASEPVSMQQHVPTQSQAGGPRPGRRGSFAGSDMSIRDIVQSRIPTDGRPETFVAEHNLGKKSTRSKSTVSVGNGLLANAKLMANDEVSSASPADRRATLSSVQSSAATDKQYRKMHAEALRKLERKNAECLQLRAEIAKQTKLKSDDLKMLRSQLEKERIASTSTSSLLEKCATLAQALHHALQAATEALGKGSATPETLPAADKMNQLRNMHNQIGALEILRSKPQRVPLGDAWGDSINAAMIMRNYLQDGNALEHVDFSPASLPLDNDVGPLPEPEPPVEVEPEPKVETPVEQIVETTIVNIQMPITVLVPQAPVQMPPPEQPAQPPPEQPQVSLPASDNARNRRGSTTVNMSLETLASQASTSPKRVKKGASPHQRRPAPEREKDIAPWAEDNELNPILRPKPEPPPAKATDTARSPSPPAPAPRAGRQSKKRLSSSHAPEASPVASSAMPAFSITQSSEMVKSGGGFGPHDAGVSHDTVAAGTQALELLAQLSIQGAAGPVVPAHINPSALRKAAQALSLGVHDKKGKLKPLIIRPTTSQPGDFSFKPDPVADRDSLLADGKRASMAGWLPSPPMTSAHPSATSSLPASSRPSPRPTRRLRAVTADADAAGSSPEREDSVHESGMEAITVPSMLAALRPAELSALGASLQAQQLLAYAKSMLQQSRSGAAARAASRGTSSHLPRRSLAMSRMA